MSICLTADVEFNESSSKTTFLLDFRLMILSFMTEKSSGTCIAALPAFVSASIMYSIFGLKSFEMKAMS